MCWEREAFKFRERAGKLNRELLSYTMASANATSVVRIRRKGGVVVQDCDVYIGRNCFMGGWKLKKSYWANPFTAKECGSNEAAAAKFETWVRGQPEMMARVPELRGKTLGCWCKPSACHGDVLVKLVAELGAP